MTQKYFPVLFSPSVAGSNLTPAQSYTLHLNFSELSCSVHMLPLLVHSTWYNPHTFYVFSNIQ